MGTKITYFEKNHVSIIHTYCIKKKLQIIKLNCICGHGSNVAFWINNNFVNYFARFYELPTHFITCSCLFMCGGLSSVYCSQALVSFKKYMPPPLTCFIQNIFLNETSACGTVAQRHH
jgi:hypothetical protein